MPAHPVIELRDVDIDVDGARLVHRLSVDVAAGRVLAILSERATIRTAISRVLAGESADYRVGGDLVMDGRELVSRVGSPAASERHVARIPGPLDSRTRLQDLAAADVLERVGLQSGDARVTSLDEAGRIRAAFALALSAGPRVLVLELPYLPQVGSPYPIWSALVQSIAREGDLAIVVVTDSLAVAADVADDVLVTLDGRAIERGSVYDVCLRPAMPYVQELVRFTPSPHRALPDAPRFVDITAHQGCPWVLNCRADVVHACSQDVPVMRSVGLGHAAACHLLGGPRAT